MRAIGTALLLSMGGPAWAGPADGGSWTPSIEQEVGQLFMAVIDSETAARYEDHIRTGRLGGGLLRWDRFTAGELRRLTGRLREWSASEPGQPPFLVAADHEGGPLFTQRSFGATIFPGNMALGAAADPDLTLDAAETSALELRALGVDADFAPAIDVNSDPRNPIIGVRSFGEDPAAVARFGAAAVRGYRAGGVLACAKHFPGHGDTDVDSHTGLPVIRRSRAELEAVDLEPFRAAIAADVPMIMTAHISVPALGTDSLPATLSTAVLRGLLREEMGFKGVIVSDSLDMGAITKTVGGGPAESAIQAFLGGCDLLLLGRADYEPVYEAFVEAVKRGRIPRERVAESAERIMRMKRRQAEGGAARTGGRGAAGLADRIGERSVTVLRDEAGLLPLRLQAARNLRAVLLRSSRFSAETELFVRELRREHPRVEAEMLSWRPEEDLAGVLDRAREADVLIVGTYLWGAEPPHAQRRMVGALLRLGVPAVLVSMMNPYDVRHYPQARTVLLTYGPTAASLRAAAKVIFGKIEPTGRPPVTLD